MIYNRNKAPTFLFDAGIGFISLISLIYDIQIKTSLSEKRIKEAMDKYHKKTPINVLLALKGKNLLEKYKSIDKNYLINPTIKVISSEEDYYYFWKVTNISYRDLFEQQILTQFKTDKITISGEGLKDLLKKQIYKKYEWLRGKRTHNIEGFIIGLLNTLYKNEQISNYIINKNDEFIGQIVAQLYCDNENNILCEKENFDTGIVSKDKSITLQIEKKDNGNNLSVSLMNKLA